MTAGTARPDGLASLGAQRERARRTMPPSRHPLPPAAAGEDRTLPPPVLDMVPAGPGSPSSAQAVAAGETPAALGLEQAGPTFKVTLYVDRATDEFMEAARVAGLTSRPKVDVSRSAVVRLALRRLMEERSPAEVKSMLASQPVRGSGPGRKRR